MKNKPIQVRESILQLRLIKLFFKKGNGLKMYLLSCKINNSKLTIFTHRKTYKYMHTTFYGLSIHTDYVIIKKI